MNRRKYVSVPNARKSRSMALCSQTYEPAKTTRYAARDRNAMTSAVFLSQSGSFASTSASTAASAKAGLESEESGCSRPPTQIPIQVGVEMLLYRAYKLTAIPEMIAQIKKAKILPSFLFSPVFALQIGFRCCSVPILSFLSDRFHSHTV